MYTLQVTQNMYHGNILDIEKKSCIKLAIYTRVQENLYKPFKNNT